MYTKENLIDNYFKVLDKGFIALKDVMGDDYKIEQCARVSYKKGTRKVSDTNGLIRYCKNHEHTGPFEHVVFTFHVRAPWVVLKQWERHRTWSYSEESGRYSVLSEDCEQTSPDKWRLQSKDNKQGSSGYIENWPKDGCWIPFYPDNNGGVKPTTPGEFLSIEEKLLHEHARKVYEQRIKFGVAKEQARKDLPLSNYAEMFCTVDLHNLLHFLSLRCHFHSQEEIRSYANIISGIIKVCYPLSWQAWYDYNFQAVTFSRLDRILLQYISNKFHTDTVANYGWSLEQIKYYEKDYIDIKEFALANGMSRREYDEFWLKLNPPEEVDFSLEKVELYEKDNLGKVD